MIDEFITFETQIESLTNGEQLNKMLK